MAVTESSGNGYALYNGVKLPDIDTVWTDKETYPYAFTFIRSQDNEMRLFLSTGYSHAIETHVYISPPYLSFKISTDAWSLVGEFGGSSLVTFDNVFWASTDLGYGDTVYMYYTAPIPLDGMNVIEWDGDTTGLEEIQGFYKVSDLMPTAQELSVNCVLAVNNAGTFDGGVFPSDFIQSNEQSSLIGYDVICSYVEADGFTPGTYFTKYSKTGGYYYISLLAYSASAPTFDKTTFLSGLAMGLTGKGNPVSGAVGMYSYNGTMFPAVPVYDPSNPMEEGYTSECPYTVITNTPSGYYCYLTNYPLLHVDAPNSALAPSEIVSVHSFLYVDGEWQYKDSFMMTQGYTQLVVEPIWANYDILNEDESVYLAASDPTPDTFSKGYLAGAKLRAKRVIPDKPTEYNLLDFGGGYNAKHYADSDADDEYVEFAAGAFPLSLTSVVEYHEVGTKGLGVSVDIKELVGHDVMAAAGDAVAFEYLFPQIEVPDDVSFGYTYSVVQMWCEGIFEFLEIQVVNDGENAGKITCTNSNVLENKIIEPIVSEGKIVGVKASGTLTLDLTRFRLARRLVSVDVTTTPLSLAATLTHKSYDDFKLRIIKGADF